MADQTHALLRMIYNGAIACELVEDSPCRGLPRPAKIRARHHVLSEEDSRKLWSALSRQIDVVMSWLDELEPLAAGN